MFAISNKARQTQQPPPEPMVGEMCVLFDLSHQAEANGCRIEQRNGDNRVKRTYQAQPG
jgi:hypothetical protein